MQVQLVGKTEFVKPDVPWETDAVGGQALAELAGRACYQSWKKPNPETATNAGYLRHILEVGHMSVLEHGVVSFYFTGVSRSFTHELVRHRHFSYSQLSQRYVNEANAEMVVPPVIGEDPDLLSLFTRQCDNAKMSYLAIGSALMEKFERLYPDWSKTAQRKASRQAARSVLPNATETKIVITGNYRAWRHFLAMRASEHADVEIRACAIQVLRELQKVAENVFADFNIVKLEDGTEVASSPFITAAE